VAPGPYEAKEVEECLKGKRLSRRIIEKASQLLLERVSVREATMTFKMAKAKALCCEALLKAFAGPKKGGGSIA
jgi:CO/xanthine dehydrogenase FAD-binding subunit